MLPEDYEKNYIEMETRFRSILNHCIKKNKKLSQTKIAKFLNKSQNAINRWLTWNKNSQSYPNAIDFLLLCQIVKIDPGIFLKTGDSTLLYDDQKETSPFISTSVSRAIKKTLFLDAPIEKIIPVLTVPGNGTSRAISEHISGSDGICIKNTSSTTEMKKELQEKSARPKTLIFENAEWLTQEKCSSIIDTFLGQYSLIFFIKAPSGNNHPLLQYPHAKYIGSINPLDLQRIVGTLLPDLPVSCLPVIEAMTRGRIKDLLNIIRKIYNTGKKISALSTIEIVDILYSED